MCNSFNKGPYTSYIVVSQNYNLCPLAHFALFALTPMITVCGYIQYVKNSNKGTWAFYIFKVALQKNIEGDMNLLV